ncbi:diguanylate cyclase [Aliiglaciecola sp. 3_MG-2023]|uniref:diguanylate cyclase n=1 Tax=Aliiglaciecola sp. 3_MG-2023 TaxID=3062644 RepID=UPI0026E1C1A4|nr:diguanylate cyclase [Aliiglaciecola sp. 3_MG-2023]MDO6693575.1 diguanylate cyclase [Aliiglaciecola sp. 3_MG-2023]
MADFIELNTKKLLENAHIGVVIHRWDTSIIYANPTSLRLLRLNYKQIIGKSSKDPQWRFIDESGKKLLIEDYPVNKVKRTKKRLKNEVLGVLDSSADTISWFFINAYFEGEPDSPETFIVVTFTDISDSKQLFSFQAIVENTQDMVVVTEASEIDYPLSPRIIYVNKAFEKMTGYKKEDVIGETPRILQGALTDKQTTDRIHQKLENFQEVSETLLNYDANGRPYWIDMNIIPLKNKYGQVTHFAAIERDISERKFHLEQLENKHNEFKKLKTELENLIDKRTKELQTANAKLEKIAYYDPLTNIPNRRFFIDHAHRLIKSCLRRDSLVAFGLLDIDDFKVFNDTYGHDAGDIVLVEIAKYLNGFFRVDDAFCRYGGEEFAFVAAIKEADDASRLADRLLNGIRNLKVTLNTSTQISVTISMGIRVSLPSEDLDLEKGLKDADITLYHSKGEGKNQVNITFDHK